MRKIGGTTLRSIGHIGRLQRIPDNDADYVDAARHAGRAARRQPALVAGLREAHELCDEQKDVATASLIENWIDEAERRAWFLFEASRR